MGLDLGLGLVPGLMSGDANRAYINKALAMSPARYYILNESAGTTAADSGSHGTDLTVTGGTWGQEGIGDGQTALYLAGAAGDNVAGSAASMNYDEATLSFWHYSSVAGASLNEGILFEAAYNAQNHVRVHIHSTGRVYIWREINNVIYDRYFDKATMSAGWHHFATTMSVTNNTLRYWLNGVEKTSSALGATCPSAIQALSTLTLSLSALDTARYAHVAWFNSVLTDGQIGQLATAG